MVTMELNTEELVGQLIGNTLEEHMVDAEQNIGRAMLWIKIRGELSQRVICDAYAPVLKSIQNSTNFNFHHV